MLQLSLRLGHPTTILLVFSPMWLTDIARFTDRANLHCTGTITRIHIIARPASPIREPNKGNATKSLHETIS